MFTNHHTEGVCPLSRENALYRVLGKLRGGRLISELISLSVVSECTFSMLFWTALVQGGMEKIVR